MTSSMKWRSSSWLTSIVSVLVILLPFVESAFAVEGGIGRPISGASINEAEINRVIGVIEGIEAGSRNLSIDSPIHRKRMKLTSTSNMSFRFSPSASSPRRSCAGEVSDPRDGFYPCSLRPPCSSY